MKIIGIIPARYDSTRFPGKPLIMINGKTMIRRVYEQARQCQGLRRVIVATDHQAIFNHVRSFQGEVMMTSTNHRSGTERCREVADALVSEGCSFDAVVNIQGDEPFISPLQITQLTELMQTRNPEVATLVKRIDKPEMLTDPNVVKVVIDFEEKALYFSRSAIPYARNMAVHEWLNGVPYYKHIGIYGYRGDVLRRITELPVAPPEAAESLEQLRWLYNGFSIFTGQTDIDNIAIDIPEDLLKIPKEMP